MTAQQHAPEDDGLEDAVVANNEEMPDDSEGLDILEIFEELSDDERDPSCDNNNLNQKEKDPTENTDHTEDEDSLSSPPPAGATNDESHEQSSFGGFSLSNIGFVLGNATAKVGSATVGKLSQSFSALPTATALSLSQDNGAPSQSLNNSSHHANSLKAKLQRRNSSPAKMTKQVDFGEFQDRAERLQYTVDDIFDIVDDPAQFNELRDALRSFGAVTNTLIKQKIHWYVKNSKRERELLKQQQMEQQKNQSLPQLQEEDMGLRTPPTETKVFESHNIIQGISPEDISPKCVRGIFVPSS